MNNEPVEVTAEWAQIGDNQFVSPDPDDPNIYHKDGTVCECFDDEPEGCRDYENE